MGPGGSEYQFILPLHPPKVAELAVNFFTQMGGFSRKLLVSFDRLGLADGCLDGFYPTYRPPQRSPAALGYVLVTAVLIRATGGVEN